jgi:endonuclease/exonuclease/phosphatase family metal-dependent hydrolase
MKLVSYNIHYAVGRDGREDLERVVDAVRGAGGQPSGLSG